MSDETKRPQRKIRIGVIFGGRSGEHEISLQSARSVMAALNPDKYEVIPIGITRDGRWLIGDVMAALAEGSQAIRPATLLPDPQSSALMQVELAEMKPVALSAVAELDVIFPVLHGPYGEDGTVQGLLELANLPYVGAGVAGSAVAMDKGIFKHVMAANELPVLPWYLCRRQTWQQRPQAVLDEIESRLDYPIFTKPANLGSSVGISKCRDRRQLAAGLVEAARYDRRIIAEQGIKARELEVSVLGNDDPIASVVGEIRPRREFYDYVAKYISDDSELIIPAEVEAAVAVAARDMAVKAYRAIDGAGLARVDLLLDQDSGRLYINEINTIPGFTHISMYPKLWQPTGIGYTELLDRLVDLALERHEEKEQLERSYDVKRET